MITGGGIKVRATQAAAVLLAQLGGVAYRRVRRVRPAVVAVRPRGVVSAFVDAGSSLFTLGFAVPGGTAPSVIVFLAAATGLVILTLQIAYLPTLYAAFNRRETQVALLSERAGVPSWGPELLARTHYALGTGVSTLDTMPDLYARWESWAADVAESHTTYPVLVRFRSPEPLSSWVTALLAVLDSAALFLALSPEAAPVVPARLCLRGGFRCFNRVARTMGFDIPDEPDPDARTSVTYAEFLDAVARMREVGFPIERDPAEAWPDFVGWRVNYEPAAYAVAAAVYAVPALWSGPRRHQGVADPAHPASTRPPAQVTRRTGRNPGQRPGEGRRSAGELGSRIRTVFIESKRAGAGPGGRRHRRSSPLGRRPGHRWPPAVRPGSAAVPGRLASPFEQQEPQPVRSHRSSPMLALKAGSALRIRKAR